MHQEKITILFVINQTKTNQKGICLIYFRITINKVRKQFSTGHSINPSDWNTKKQLAGLKIIDYSVLNGQMSLIKQKKDTMNFGFQSVFLVYVLYVRLFYFYQLRGLPRAV